MADPQLEALCGSLLVVGFEGMDLPPSLDEALARGVRGGVLLFRRNVGDLSPGRGPTSVAGAAPRDPTERPFAAPADAAEPTGVEATWNRLARLTARVRGRAEIPPLIAIDQEGGRVRRLGGPFLTVPPARSLARLRPKQLELLGGVVGAELAAVGIDWNLAPVLDVDSNPLNPVIGDRAFGPTPEAVIGAALAFERGMRQHVGTCGKHFPGHGDTELDSHLALPTIRHGRSRVEAIELEPFRAAVAAGVPALMTAHVVFEAFDAARPATLSSVVLRDLLRRELGFEGVCVSDDLTMRGVSPSGGTDPAEVGALAVEAVAAGCDLLLIAHEGPAAEAALASLVDRARSQVGFARRIEEAAARVRGFRARIPRPAERAFGPMPRRADAEAILASS